MSAKCLLSLVCFFALRFGIPIGAVGRRLVGGVGEHHRVVEEERFRFVLLDELEGEVVDEIGAVLAIC